MFVYRMREHNFKQEPERVPKGENMDVPANVGESLLASGPPSQAAVAPSSSSPEKKAKKNKEDKEKKVKKNKDKKEKEPEDDEFDKV